MSQLKIITTPDKVVMNNNQVHAAISEYIEKHTGRKVQAQMTNAMTAPVRLHTGCNNTIEAAVILAPDDRPVTGKVVYRDRVDPPSPAMVSPTPEHEDMPDDDDGLPGLRADVKRLGEECVAKLMYKHNTTRDHAVALTRDIFDRATGATTIIEMNVAQCRAAISKLTETIRSEKKTSTVVGKPAKDESAETFGLAKLRKNVMRLGGLYCEYLMENDRFTVNKARKRLDDVLIKLTGTRLIQEMNADQCDTVIVHLDSLLPENDDD